MVIHMVFAVIFNIVFEIHTVYVLLKKILLLFKNYTPSGCFYFFLIDLIVFLLKVVSVPQ